MRATLLAMRPPQSFNIIFVNERDLPPLAASLLLVTPENRRKAIDYVDTMAPRGGQTPCPRLKRPSRNNPT